MFFNKENQKINFILFFSKSFEVYEQQTVSFELKSQIFEEYSFDLEVIHMISNSNFYYGVPEKNGKVALYWFQNNSATKISEMPYHTRFFEKYLLINTDFGIYELHEIVGNKVLKVSNFFLKNAIRNFVFDPITNSLFFGTDNKPIRSFLHLKNYPKLYRDLNSSSIFALLEDDKQNILAASYQGSIAIINHEKVTNLDLKSYFPINGSFKIKDKKYFFDLNTLLEIDNQNKVSSGLLKKQGYFGLLSREQKNIYVGLTRSKGLLKSDALKLYNKVPNWTRIDSTKNHFFDQIYTLVEDSQTRIWYGSPNEGIGFFNPKNNASGYFNFKDLNNFGPISSIKDLNGGLWFGGYDSKLTFLDGNSIKINKNNFQAINHPLLEGKKRIMSLGIFQKWLLIGAYDKILLLDLDQFYKTKKINIRYLNPFETNFTSFIEQNTMLLSKNQSLWFSTSDNLYQWDIKKWLTLPTFTVTPTIIVKKDSLETEYKINNQISFEPTQNSFDIQIQYQTPDNFPRYLNATLVKKGEKPNFEAPNLETKFHFANLNAGNYIFYVRVCQQDGSFDVFEYPLFIDNFLWQKWWFWLLMSFFPIGFIVYYFRKKNEIEITKKKLSQLNLASLSNQFRPHFMLNALNSIGSQMEQMPHAEKVISRLGESINILYGFTQSNDFTHEIKNEWKLVENIIEIQKLLFITDLEVKISNVEFINIINKVPVGLIQIPIENALLHGLRNKEKGPYCLEINFFENEIYYGIEIIDTGVGRKKASEINNFKNNGNGLKTIFQMIEIINNQDPKAIIFEILDQLIGTKVIIQLKKIIDYDKIKL